MSIRNGLGLCWWHTIGVGQEKSDGSGLNDARLWTVRDVAEHLRVHEKTVYAWAESGKLRCTRVGNRIRFDPNDITRWLASRKE